RSAVFPTPGSPRRTTDRLSPPRAASSMRSRATHSRSRPLRAVCPTAAIAQPTLHPDWRSRLACWRIRAVRRAAILGVHQKTSERRHEMKIVVIGGTGLIGSKLVDKLRRAGHEAVPASPDTGVDTYTGEGLEQAL